MSQPTQNQPGPTEEWGIMILLDLVGSTPQGLVGSDKELREYHRQRIEHVTECARKHGIERLDDQGDADILFLPGDRAQPLLELFHDLNRRNPVPAYLHFQPVLRMVAHHHRFAFSPRDAKGLRKQLSSNHLTLQFRFEKACPERALLMTRPLYELVRDHIPPDWLRCNKHVPQKLGEWLKIIGDEIYWIGLPGDDLQTKVEATYARLCDEARAPKPVAAAERETKSDSEPSEPELRSLFVNRILDVVLLAATIIILWHGMHGNWYLSVLFPISVGLKGMWIMWDLPPEVKVLAFMALFAFVGGSTILFGNLVAKKESRSGSWNAGWGFLAYGAGMATVLVVMQSRRGGIPPTTGIDRSKSEH